jgi:ABC-2 type transport system ATP-binding protein
MLLRSAASAEHPFRGGLVTIGWPALRWTPSRGVGEGVDPGAEIGGLRVLEIDGVSKRYGDVRALADMTFTVRPGELFGFVGANGAGKTTTMRIVLGVLAADAGEVRLDGRPVDARRRRRIGYMPEERGLYPRMAVGEQLRYLAQLHGLTAAAARRAAEQWAERLGVAARLADEVQRLSLGNQQRV